MSRLGLWPFLNTLKNVSVGGVRSARPYFVATVAEYGAIYAHHGADASVLALIPEYGVENVSGMLYDGSTYQRQSHKVAPHNSYTSLDALDERADQLGYSDTNHFNGFTFYEYTNDWWYSSNDRLPHLWQCLRGHLPLR